MPKSKSAYSIPGKIGKLERHIIVIWVDNEAGVLARVVGLFSGRGYNIESLAVAEVDKKIKEMIDVQKPVIFDCVVDKSENCFPMIPSGKPHNQMLLGPEEDEEISDEGKILV